MQSKKTNYNESVHLNNAIDSDSEPSTASTEKKRTVKGFFHFEMENNFKIGVCKLCSTRKCIKMKDSNTSGLKKHLKSIHRNSYEEIFGVNVNVAEKGQLKLEDAFKSTSKVNTGTI